MRSTSHQGDQKQASSRCPRIFLFSFGPSAAGQGGGGAERHGHPEQLQRSYRSIQPWDGNAAGGHGPRAPVKERGRREWGASEGSGHSGADIAKALKMSAEASTFSKQDDGKMASILSKRGGLSSKARTGEGAQALAHALTAGAKSRHVVQLGSPSARHQQGPLPLAAQHAGVRPPDHGGL